MDLGLRVVQGAQVDDLGVAGDREGGGDQRIALVARAAQLLDGVGVVGEGTLGVAGAVSCPNQVPEVLSSLELSMVPSAEAAQSLPLALPVWAFQEAALEK